MFRPYHQAFTMNRQTVKMRQFLGSQTQFISNKFIQLSVMCCVACRRFIRKVCTNISGNQFLNLSSEFEVYIPATIHNLGLSDFVAIDGGSFTCHEIDRNHLDVLMRSILWQEWLKVKNDRKFLLYSCRNIYT